MIFIASLALVTLPQDSEFLPATRIKADGKPIDVTVGHAAPFFKDWDGDGVDDLLVGEFGDLDFPKDRLPESQQGKPGNAFSQSKLRIYKNYGTKANPLFKGFEYLKSGDQHASIPST